MLNLESPPHREKQANDGLISAPSPRDFHAWKQGLLAILLLNLLALPYLINGEDMARGGQNWDTRSFAHLIPLEKNPLSWFWSDWPLKNGFYRPIPALSFLFDIKLFGPHFQLYRIQEFVVAIACAFASTWLVWEITRRKKWAIASGMLFSILQTDVGLRLELAWTLPILTAIYGHHLYKRGLLAPIALIQLVILTVVLGYELSKPPGEGDWYRGTFGYRSMGWPPGRTSAFLALTALTCLAAFARWLRDWDLKWLGISILGFGVSFLNYEQAVILPALLVGVLVVTRPFEWKRALLPIALSVVFTALYWRWHVVHIPMNTAYQYYHRRGNVSAILDVVEYLMPGTHGLGLFSHAFHLAQLKPCFTDIRFLGILLSIATTIWVFQSLDRNVRWSIFAILASAVAFAPLCLAKPLYHYAYFSSCLRPLFWVSLGYTCWQILGPSVGRAANRGDQLSLKICQLANYVGLHPLTEQGSRV
jgi:hypothetical protein